MTTPIGDGIAAEVSGIVTTGPRSRSRAVVEAGMDRYAVLVFRDQALTDDTQRAFTLVPARWRRRRGGRRQPGIGGCRGLCRMRQVDQHQRVLAPRR